MPRVAHPDALHASAHPPDRCHVDHIASGTDAPSLLVELLTTRWPDLRARLLAEHTDDGTGRCRRCRVPGYGTPGGQWPCLLANLADQAERRATQQGETST